MKIAHIFSKKIFWQWNYNCYVYYVWIDALTQQRYLHFVRATYKYFAFYFSIILSRILHVLSTSFHCLSLKKCVAGRFDNWSHIIYFFIIHGMFSFFVCLPRLQPDNWHGNSKSQTRLQGPGAPTVWSSWSRVSRYLLPFVPGRRFPRFGGKYGAGNSAL